MARAEAAQFGIGNNAAFDFKTTGDGTATTLNKPSAANQEAVANGSFFASSYAQLGDTRRLVLEQRFAQTVSARPVANTFVERHPAAQGLKFSETKSASDLAYEAKKGEIYEFPDGKKWRVVDAPDSGGGIFKSGFRAVVLQPVDANDKRVIVSYAGSGKQLGDWINNASQAGGNTPKQYREALALARKYQEKYGSNVILTGHSLGGGLASYASLKTGLRATAINSAPLSPNNLGGNALFQPSVKNNARITQYYVPGEVLTNLDNVDLFDARPGSKIAIPGKYNRWVDPRAAIGNHMLGNLAIDVPAPRKIN